VKALLGETGKLQQGLVLFNSQCSIGADEKRTAAYITFNKKAIQIATAHQPKLDDLLREFEREICTFIGLKPSLTQVRKKWSEFFLPPSVGMKSSAEIRSNFDTCCSS
jgi:uncharacterized protein YicC (UPF0701 family)